MKAFKFILVLILIPFISFSQSSKKAFKKLEKGEINEAKVTFIKMLEENENDAIANYGLAVIYSKQDNVNYDLFKAREKIIIANNNFKNIDAETLTKLEEYISIETFKESKETIEEKLKDYVISENNIETSLKYVESCKDSKFYNEILTLLHKQEYKKALEFNNELALKEFIKKYPMAEQAGQAQEHIFSIAWNKANKENTKKAFREFMRNYPTATQYNIALDKIREIDFKRAMAMGTDDAFEFFINQYPNTKQSIALINEWEKTLYKQAKTIKAVKVYNRYLNKFPNSENTAEIKALRDELEYQNALNKNTQQAYAEFVEKYPNSKQINEAMDKLNKFSYSKAELMNFEKRNKIINNKIQSVKIYKQFAGDTIPKLFKEMKYDGKGNLFKNISYLNDNTIDELIYKYSFDGNYIEQEAKFVNNSLIYDSKFNYDENKLIDYELKSCFKDCTNDTSYLKYEYDNNRNLITIKEFSEDKLTLLKTTTLTYNNINLLVQKQFSSDSLELNIIKINYQYDSYGNLIQVTEFSDDNTIYSIIINKYENGLKVKSIHTDPIGKFSKTYNYNFKGILLSEDIDFEDKNEIDYSLIYEYK